MANITVIGVGYVGLVTGACLADLGNDVVCLNRNKRKSENLKKGILPILAGAGGDRAAQQRGRASAFHHLV